MANVKIALRVRPLSEKESLNEISSQTVVEIEDDKTVAITNPKVPPSNAGDSRERIKRFAFDFCFDSTNENSENYATQEMVYDKLGGLILDSLARCQDACVLAYGQSASGKTHTMQGTEDQPGLTPRLAEAVMTTSSGEPAQATISYYEIYNERVHDLLSPEDLQSPSRDRSSSTGCSRELRVRQHPVRGPYVEGLSGLEVRSPLHAASLAALGASRRRAARTPANPHSSRSHALLALRRAEPAATLTLLDLAGSERPSSISQSLPRQKEGANINKSLVALANVISALACSRPRACRYVPYRDSVLTWLLKDTLAGSTTTVMIATVSPSRSCYTETVNTMRWAARAGRIPATARASTSPHERALRALRAEVAHLRKLLREATAAALTATSQISAKDETKNVPSVNEGAGTSKPNLLEAHEIIEEVSDTTIKEENIVENETEEKEKEGGNSLNSLASSRLSIASNDTVSGNVSIPSTQGSNVNSSQAEDALFGPRMHRTGSVHDVKPLPPLRNKKRQYSSHETLPSLENSALAKNQKTAATNKDATKRDISNLSNARAKVHSLPRGKSTLSNSDTQSIKSNAANNTNGRTSETMKPKFPYQPFNKRADIVASVTDRLYTKLKKSEENAFHKMESPVERRMSQPLTELKICSNARQKLFDIGHRALRASRRFRIGVPAETQTDKNMAIRVKEVAIDTQDDMEPFKCKIGDEKLYKNVSMATEAITLLCKEASVETINCNLYSDDKGVETDKVIDTGNLTITRTCGNMTEDMTTFSSISTQTSGVSPERKKHSSFTKYLKINHAPPVPSENNERSPSRVLNISIMHDFLRVENDGDAISDDSLEGDPKINNNSKSIHTTPDLLNNHNSEVNGDPCCSYSPIKTAKQLECSSKSLRDNIDIKSSEMGGNKAIESCEPVMVENEFDPKCRNSQNLTINPSLAGINRGDRVSASSEAIMKQGGVTSGAFPLAVHAPTISKPDTTKRNKKEQIKENCSYESKSIQVGFPQSYYADFLEDVYVPLPKICVSPDYCADRWPEMKNIIMGRNDDMYPYNIKYSPRRASSCNRRKSCKSVSWKIDDEASFRHSDTHLEYCGTSKVHKPLGSNFESLSSQNSDNENSNYSCDSLDDRNFFKGIHCWNDRPTLSNPTRQTVYQNIRKYEKRDSEKCLEYLKTTSNFLTEATNLVTTLNKVSSKMNEPQLNQCQNAMNVSPVCKEKLQTDDEIYIQSQNNNPGVINKSSISFHRTNPSILNNSSLFINESLVNDEEQRNSIKMSSRDHSPCKEDVQMIEKQLMDSINRFEETAKKSGAYFQALKNKYSSDDDTYDGPFKSLPVFDGESYARSRRTPSKYLQQLLDLRKELVESTKRDDDIYKHFQND